MRSPHTSSLISKSLCMLQKLYPKDTGSEVVWDLLKNVMQGRRGGNVVVLLSTGRGSNPFHTALDASPVRIGPDEQIHLRWALNNPFAKPKPVVHNLYQTLCNEKHCFHLAQQSDPVLPQILDFYATSRHHRGLSSLFGARKLEQYSKIVLGLIIFLYIWSPFIDPAVSPSTSQCLFRLALLI